MRKKSCGDLSHGLIMPMSKLPEIVSNTIFSIFKFHNPRSKFARASMFTDTQSHRNTHTGSDRQTHIVAMIVVIDYLTIMYQSRGPYQICKVPRAVRPEGCSNLICPRGWYIIVLEYPFKMYFALEIWDFYALNKLK